MPRSIGKSKNSPAYCLHKSSGRAFVALDGKPDLCKTLKPDPTNCEVLRNLPFRHALLGPELTLPIG
jgi:hypothetical protein